MGTPIQQQCIHAAECFHFRAKGAHDECGQAEFEPGVGGKVLVASVTALMYSDGTVAYRRWGERGRVGEILGVK